MFLIFILGDGTLTNFEYFNKSLKVALVYGALIHKFYYDVRNLKNLIITNND